MAGDVWPKRIEDSSYPQWPCNSLGPRVSAEGFQKERNSAYVISNKDTMLSCEQSLRVGGHFMTGEGGEGPQYQDP